jgi:opacity protein-like surface antigen
VPTLVWQLAVKTSEWREYQPHSYSKRRNEMRTPILLGGIFVLSLGSAFAQSGSLSSSSTKSSTTTTSIPAMSYPKLEMSPGFLFIRTSLNLTNSFVVKNPNTGAITTITGANQFNCAGGGSTMQYNMSSMFAIQTDLGGCKVFGNTIGLGNKITGSQFNYLFGPKITFRTSSGLAPFFDLGFGGDRFSVKCQSSASNCVNSTGGNSYSKNAFAMTVGGGLDIRLSNKVSLRPFQAEYLYTRFGNSCANVVCSNNNNQNSFRLKSGIVVAWGGGYGSRK